MSEEKKVEYGLRCDNCTRPLQRVHPCDEEGDPGDETLWCETCNKYFDIDKFYKELANQARDIDCSDGSVTPDIDEDERERFELMYGDFHYSCGDR